MISINSLPDSCLIAIFAKLLPAEQMLTRKVCRRWADLMANAAWNTRSLAILIGDLDLDDFEQHNNIHLVGTSKVASMVQMNGSQVFTMEYHNEWNTLLYEEGLDEVTVEAIAATFANLDTLQIGLYHASSLQFELVSHLLELWSHQLTTLKVYEHFCRLNDHSVNRLFAAINGLTTLKHLHLHLLCLPLRNLPIISQLEHLHVYWMGCSPRHFAALLRQNAITNTSLRSIEYLHEELNSSSLKHFISLGDHLLTRFTHFGIPFDQFTNCDLISTHFRHLTSLDIKPPTTTLRRLFGHLCKLTQLLFLDIIFDFELILPDDQQYLLLPQLPSVKALQMCLDIKCHHQLEQLMIGWTMPNVEAIGFSVRLGAKCVHCAVEDLRNFNHAAQHCCRQMFISLKRNCTKLRAILCETDDLLDAIAQEVMSIE